MADFWDVIDEIDKRNEDYKTWNRSIPVYFYGYERETRITLYSILVFMLKAHQFFQLSKNPLTVIGVVLNVLHLIVLTRKSMRTGSINMILISLAIHDLLLLLLRLYIEYESIIFPYDHCVPLGLFSYCLTKILSATQMFLRRSSSWLVILMATIRSVCIAFVESDKMAFLITTKFGITAVIFEFILSSSCSLPIVIFFLFEPLYYPGHPGRKWVPPEGCTGYPPGYSVVTHTMDYPAPYENRDMLIDGITVNLIPSLCYPFLSIILVRALFKSNENRRRLRQDTSKDRTTHIVITMTVTFMLAELPQGILYVLHMMQLEYGFSFMASLLTNAFNILSLVNAATHCIICFSLSSNYRDAVYGILRLSDNQTRVLFRQQTRVPANAPTINTAQVMNSNSQ